MYKLKQMPEDFIVEELPFLKPERSGSYTYFVLEKKECNTEDAVREVSKRFNLPVRHIGYAGSKDRNAVTRQYCSAKGKIWDFSKKEFSVKVIGYGPSPISLGQHTGNRFIITIRDILSSPKPSSFFINYFDEQRFSSHNLEVGLAILKKDFRKAAMLVDNKYARAHLLRYQEDYIGAIRKVPFRLLKMYVHSAQAWLWNQTAACYIKSLNVKYHKVKYSRGVFLFPDKRIENTLIPLVSFDTEFRDKKIEQLYLEIMSKHGLQMESFIVRSIPGITPLGKERELIAEIKSLEIGKLQKDELNPGKRKVILQFQLGKGCYATMAIKKLFLAD